MAPLIKSASVLIDPHLPILHMVLTKMAMAWKPGLCHREAAPGDSLVGALARGLNKRFDSLRMNLASIIWLVIVVYLLGCKSAGSCLRRHVRGVEDFAIAGRTLGLNLGIASPTQR